jgi:chromate reductase, NAD(P)H dehydrogenase (quinone)
VPLGKPIVKDPANLVRRTMIKILAIPGSLRANSSSNKILSAVISMAPTDVSIGLFDGVGNLPHFNDSDEVNPRVEEFRTKIKTADAVLICTPEYAFGVPGSLKNALDWTVASGEFIDKPVGLITASSQGEKGHAALLLILTAISSTVVSGATLLISFVRSKLDQEGRIKDPQVSNDLSRVLHALVQSVETKKFF